MTRLLQLPPWAAFAIALAAGHANPVFAQPSAEPFDYFHNS